MCFLALSEKTRCTVKADTPTPHFSIWRMPKMAFRLILHVQLCRNIADALPMGVEFSLVCEIFYWTHGIPFTDLRMRGFSTGLG